MYCDWAFTTEEFNWNSALNTGYLWLLCWCQYCVRWVKNRTDDELRRADCCDRQWNGWSIAATGKLPLRNANKWLRIIDREIVVKLGISQNTDMWIILLMSFNIERFGQEHADEKLKFASHLLSSYENQGEDFFPRSFMTADETSYHFGIVVTC